MMHMFQRRINDIVELFLVPLESEDARESHCRKHYDGYPRESIAVRERARRCFCCSPEDLRRHAGDLALHDGADEGLVACRGADDHPQLGGVRA